MRLLFTGCMGCGARTTSPEGLCPDCLATGRSPSGPPADQAAPPVTRPAPRRRVRMLRNHRRVA